MQRLVSRADFARLVDKSRAAVTQHCKGKLADACVGDRLDLNHPAARAYLQEHGVNPPSRTRSDRAPTKPAKKRSSKARAPTRSRKQGSSEPSKPTAVSLPRPDPETGFIAEFSDLTHREIVERFGTIRLYKDILEAHEKRERARRNWLDNEQTEGSLIERERVRAHILGFIEASHKRILSDAVKTIVQRLLAMIKSGATPEECEKVARDTLGSILRPARDAAVRNLRRKKTPKKPTTE